MKQYDMWHAFRANMICCCAMLSTMVAGVPALGQPLVVAGSPGYDSATGTGFQLTEANPLNVNNAGVAMSTCSKYDGSSNVGSRAVHWDGSGTFAAVLGNLNADPNVNSVAIAKALNDAGTIVGGAVKYVGGKQVGPSAVRWDASGTATELGNLGIAADGTISSAANDVNNAGTTVGYSYKYVGGKNLGQRAVRWDASGTVPTELETLGTSSNGVSAGAALAVNDFGTAVGQIDKYLAGRNVGTRAVRWDAMGAVTELGNLGIGASGFPYANVQAMNNAGTAVGYSEKDVGGKSLGQRAVRWDASGTAAIELGNLGTDSSGVAYSQAVALSDVGVAVGEADKYVAGRSMGGRAVRWDASGAVTELGNLGTSATGTAGAFAFSVNDSSAVVGTCDKYIGSVNVGPRATLWRPNGEAIDLNDLGVVANPPDGTWLLTVARSVSNTGWVAGSGTFTPIHGAPYTRSWVTHVSLAVPEPGAMQLAIFAVMGCGAWRAARRTNSRGASRC
jgi:hypothetical protein